MRWRNVKECRTGSRSFPKGQIFVFIQTRSKVSQGNQFCSSAHLTPNQMNALRKSVFRQMTSYWLFDNKWFISNLWFWSIDSYPFWQQTSLCDSVADHRQYAILPPKKKNQSCGILSSDWVLLFRPFCVLDDVRARSGLADCLGGVSLTVDPLQEKTRMQMALVNDACEHMRESVDVF